MLFIKLVVLRKKQIDIIHNQDSERLASSRKLGDNLEVPVDLYTTVG